MIEKTIKMKKDNVVKDIEERLVPDYLFVGWTKVEDTEEDNGKVERKLFKKE